MEGRALSVGFYPMDPQNGEPINGPHYTRQEAVKSVGTPCCILEVVGDWQQWMAVPIPAEQEDVNLLRLSEDSGTVAADAAESAD